MATACFTQYTDPVNKRVAAEKGLTDFTVAKIAQDVPFEPSDLVAYDALLRTAVDAYCTRKLEKRRVLAALREKEQRARQRAESASEECKKANFEANMAAMSAHLAARRTRPLALRTRPTRP